MGLVLFMVGMATSQPVEQLKFFEPFIGEWILDNTLQVFKWGPGQTSVIAMSYRLDKNHSRTLISQGMWVWHPGEEQVKGYITATNMPVSFFEYTTSYKTGKMASDLFTYDKTGNKTEYREEMKIDSDTTYTWILLRRNEIVMEDTFTRK